MKMYFLLNMGIFHCYVSLLEGNRVGFECGQFGSVVLSGILGWAFLREEMVK